MTDDKSKTTAADRTRVSLTEDYEVQYWCQRFGVSRDELADAVKKAGNSVEAVQAALTQKSRK